MKKLDNNIDAKQHILPFFISFIGTLKKDIKSIGIITDKDGTLLLNSELKKILEDLRSKEMGVKIYIIANTGRTISDMVDCLEKEDIPVEYFNYIVGDNGGICFDVKEKSELFKQTMEKDVVEEVIQHFIESGNDLAGIRMTDGENIYAFDSPEVRNYYSESQSVIFKEDIGNISDIDVTKLTLAAPHPQINELYTFLRNNFPNHRCHIGKTSFPATLKNNYRIDFTRYAYEGHCV